METTLEINDFQHEPGRKVKLYEQFIATTSFFTGSLSNFSLTRHQRKTRRQNYKLVYLHLKFNLQFRSDIFFQVLPFLPVMAGFSFSLI